MHLINRRRGARSSWPAPGAEPGNQDDLVFTVGPSRDVTDWFYIVPGVCAHIPALRRYEGARRHTLLRDEERRRGRKRRRERKKEERKEEGKEGSEMKGR